MREAATAALEMAGGHGRADVSSNLMLAIAWRDVLKSSERLRLK
jgi:hypothetical protein